MLRPGGAPADAVWPGDDDPAAGHFAVRDDAGAVVAIGTVVPEPHPAGPRAGDWRIRGMATAPAARGRGLGGAIVRACVAHARVHGAQRVWLHARVAATGLYEREGFAVEGGAFDVAGIGPHVRMSRAWISAVPDPPPLFDRLPEQYFTRLLAAAAQARAAPGPRFLDLGRGNPDLPPPPEALDALTAAAREVDGPAVHGYPPFGGLPALKEAIAERYAADHGVALDPGREVAVVPGTKTGIMLAVAATAAPGSAVLVPDPGYPDYRSGVALAGAQAVPLPLPVERHFQPDFAVAPAAALTILNYPANPCAVCARPGTFEAAVAWAREHDGWVLHDLAYDRLTFDGRPARSVLEADGAREVAVELWSPSKVYGMAGWRIGFLVGASAVVARVQALIDHTTAGVWTGVQRGLEAALRGDQRGVAERCATYRRRRDLIVPRLPGVVVPEGTFYVWWRLPEGLTAERLLREHRVGVAPGVGFGARGEGWVRLSLAIGDDEVAEAADRLAQATV